VWEGGLDFCKGLAAQETKEAYSRLLLAPSSAQARVIRGNSLPGPMTSTTCDCSLEP